nr:hypothetical protein [Tanacetum cinerariifolium]
MSSVLGSSVSVVSSVGSCCSTPGGGIGVIKLELKIVHISIVCSGVGFEFALRNRSSTEVVLENYGFAVDDFDRQLPGFVDGFDFDRNYCLGNSSGYCFDK